MRKNNILTLLVLILGVNFYGQKNELGSVTKDELLQKRHPTDTSAVAAIAFKKGKTKFVYNDEKGFSSHTEFIIKIKIFKKEGLGWANFQIPYYIGDKNLDDEIVEISKAYTYNLEGTTIEKTKVDGGGKFVNKINEFWKTIVVTFPNVKVGSIIEMKCVLKSPNLSVLPEFKFQYDIPVDYMEYITEIPEFFIYQVILSGKLKVDMKEEINYGYQDYEVKLDKAKVSESMSYKQIVTKYSQKNIKALIEEDYVTNMENYYGKLEQELQMIRYPNQEPKKIADDWESLTKTIYKDKNFGKELNKNSYLVSDLSRLIKDSDSDQEKVDKIFHYIKTRMTWNEKYGYYTDKGVEQAYKYQTGNIAEINMILTAMLRLAGLNSYSILTSSRENGIVAFPNQSKYNYLLSSVILNDKTILLDATSKNATTNLLPIRDLNWYGRMIKGDGSSSEIELMPSFLSNKTTTFLATISPNGTIEGKIREQHYDYKAIDFKEKYGKVAPESYLEMLEKKRNNSELFDYSVSGVDGDNRQITENYSFKNDNSVEVIGDKMFFSPLLFFASSSNPFKQENREYPIDFIFPQSNEYKVSINIPESYAIESVPKETIIALKDNLIILSYSIATTENRIQFSMKFNINTAIMLPERYNELKTLFSDIILKENEKIVLKKI